MIIQMLKKYRKKKLKKYSFQTVEPIKLTNVLLHKSNRRILILLICNHALPLFEKYKFRTQFL